MQIAPGVQRASLEKNMRYYETPDGNRERENPVSYASEVIADNSGKFCGNGCRYATYEEARLAGLELMSRWMLVRETRVVESSDPVNYAFVAGRSKSL